MAHPEERALRIRLVVPVQLDGVVRDGRLHTLLTPIHGRRGHSLGLVGITLAEPPPGFVRCHCGWAHGLPHYTRAAEEKR